MRRSRAVITGASGLLGSALTLDLGTAWDVIAISRHRPLRSVAERSLLLDVSDPRSADVIAELEPALIVHCAAATNVDACERDPQWASAVNVDGSRHVAMAAERAGARLIHISTDAVFDGARGGYVEGDATGPLNVYSRTKLEAELEVRANAAGAIVVRTSIYGWNAEPKLSLAEWVLERAEAGSPVPGFHDIHFTPILTDSLSDAIAALARSDVAGVLHVSGTERISKHDFARAVLRVFGLDEDLVRPASVEDGGPAAPRPRDTSLDCSRAASLGLALPDVGEGLERFARGLENGRRQRLRDLLEGN